MHAFFLDTQSPVVYTFNHSKFSTCGNYDQRELSPLHIFGKFNLNMWIHVPEAIFVSAIYKNDLTKNRTRG